MPYWLKMGKLLKAAGMIGGTVFAGLVGFLAYKLRQSMRMNLHEKPKLPGDKRHIYLAQERDKRLGEVSKTCLEKIKQVEAKYFQGISNLMKPDPSTLAGIINLLLENGVVNKSDVSDISSFHDVLLKLRDRNVLGPTNYLHVLQRLFTEIGYDMSHIKSELEEFIRTLVREVMRLVQSEYREKRVDEDEKVDILILYSENDNDNARTLVNNIKQHVSIEDLRVELMDTVCPSGMLSISSVGKALESCLYIFIIISHSFKEDELNRFLGETGLVSDLKRNENRWRFVPVWMTKEMSKPPDAPFEYCGLVGMNYFKYLDKETDKECFQSINKLVNNGRREEARRAGKERSGRRNLEDRVW